MQEQPELQSDIPRHRTLSMEEVRPLEYISETAQRRISDRGISEEMIAYCIQNARDAYTYRGDNVYVATLPDGRTIKVTRRPGSAPKIVNAFCPH